MVRWLLYGNAPAAARERFAAAAAASGVPLTEEGQSRWVREVLSHFDLVGRTEQLAAFIASARAVLGWPLFTAPLAAKNPTPLSNRYALSLVEQRWTMKHTALDASLVDHFCASRQAGCQTHSSAGRWDAWPSLNGLNIAPSVRYGTFGPRAPTLAIPSDKPQLFRRSAAGNSPEI